MSNIYQNLARRVGPVATAFALLTFEAQSFPLVVSSDRQAELVTCGCSIEQLGGLSRIPAALASKGLKPDKERLWLDGGDLFFTSLGLSEERLGKEKDGARLLAKVYKQWGVEVMTPGPKDLAGGVGFLKEMTAAAGIEAVSANLRDEQDQLLFKPWKMVKRTGYQIAVVGVSGKGIFEKVPGVRVSDADAAVRQAFIEAKRAGANFFVVLSQAGLSEDKARAKLVEADVWISGAATDSLAEPLKVGKTWIAQLLPQGQQVGVFYVEPKKEVRFESISVVHNLKEDKKIKREIDALKKKQRAADVPKAASGKMQKFVANFEACRRCHAKQVAFWEGTDHASAYLVLYSKNTHFDRECITCHTLGFEKDPRFVKIAHPLLLDGESPKPGESFAENLVAAAFTKAGIADATNSALSPREKPQEYAKVKRAYHEELAALQKAGRLENSFLGVQCEHCHGNLVGHPHVKSPVKKVSETSCRECHRAPNAPNFSPSMIPKVACPLMGS